MSQRAASREPSDLADREFRAIAALAMSEAGLNIPDSKRALVQSRISKRMRNLGIGRFEDYVSVLNDPDNGAERRELVSVLTTNVSSFYRERHHFEFFAQQVLPALRAKLESGGRVRLWSAGCSSGQEPYTLAIELLRAIPDATRHDILILATDIDPDILARARAGQYQDTEVSVLSEADRSRFLVAAPGGSPGFAVADAVRRLVRFRELNLHGPWPMRGRFDAIFCRNVVIYFGDAHQAALWPRFRDALEPEGYLFLGHSERIHPLNGSGFTAGGVTTYRKEAGATSASEGQVATCH